MKLVKEQSFLCGYQESSLLDRTGWLVSMKTRYTYMGNGQGGLKMAYRNSLPGFLYFKLVLFSGRRSEEAIREFQSKW
jgi:hypothetical protein